jgi:hypothetical protein
MIMDVALASPEQEKGRRVVPRRPQSNAKDRL